jgi:CBS domain-containing protein
MTRDVVTVTPDAPVAEVVRLLLGEQLRALPIVDASDQVVGIISDGDLLRRGSTALPLHLQQILAAEGQEVPKTPRRAVDVMTTDPHTLRDTLPLAAAAEQFARHDLKRFPVVDAAGTLVGIVSRSGLLGNVSEALEQQAREATARPPTAPARRCWRRSSVSSTTGSSGCRWLMRMDGWSAWWGARVSWGSGAPGGGEGGRNRWVVVTLSTSRPVNGSRAFLEHR